ncbi:MAG: transketolase C-terminal domain-containing protein [Candidatus Kariarchaeaceae archaeon]|jgi:pyruvate/2-oxoacid:ferredoxin oxidoreductase alpha subunit
MLKSKNLEIWTGNEAVAQGAIISRPQVVAAYPITPSTAIIQSLSDAIESGQLKGEFIAVESEHAAMAANMGASAAGARAFTATASQGLLYMAEMIFMAGYSRLPMTIGIVNRCLYGGWSIWVDHQDMYSMRDAGWIQFAAKNNQEAYDLIPQSYKVSEDHDVYIPSMVNIDGFTLSHVAGQVEPLKQQMVDDFLPPFVPMFNLDPSDPISFGALTLPGEYLALREDLVESFDRAKVKIRKVSQEFAELTGRDWGGLVEIYGPENADVGIVALGTLGEEVEETVDYLNSKGGSFGATRIRTLRPFPHEEMIDAAKRYGRLVVLDRGYSFGSDSPVVTEIRSTLYRVKSDTPVHGVVIGIGGAEVPYKNIAEAVQKAVKEEI